MFNLEKLTAYSPFCFSCLGRAVGRIGFGLDNRERGLEMLNLLELQEESVFVNKLICPSTKCKICDGLIAEIDNFIGLVSESLSDYSISTFKVGTVVDKDILQKEEEFQSLFNSEGESIKSQLNREIGIGVYQESNIEAKIEDPEAVAIIDTRYDTVDLEIKSLFIEGNYNKYDRTIPQTRWPCNSCKGVGCKKCNNTGKLYQDSVQSLISKKFIDLTSATKDLFHGMGREDIDAAMLGNGRPFILELRKPRKREINLESIAKEINSESDRRIKVTNLRMVQRSRVAELKNTVCDKTYRVEVSIPSFLSIESLKKGAQRLTGAVVEQRTPTRVSHRRADLVRPRLIGYVDIKSFAEGRVELEIRAQHGTYIRELVSGDMDRTDPSLSSLVASACKVEVLDVLNLHLKNREKENG